MTLHPNSLIAGKSIKSTGTDKLHREVILRTLSKITYYHQLGDKVTWFENAATSIRIAKDCLLDRYQVSRRMSELIRDGLVTELDVVYKPDNGRPQAVFQLTEKGIESLQTT